MQLLQQQHILILGLGTSGLAMARWCQRMGAQLTVADSRVNPPQLEALNNSVPSARFVSQAFTAELLSDDIQAVFISPGIAPQMFQSLADAAHAQDVPVGNELDLFMQALAHLNKTQSYKPCVLGITGTNGKTTVTALVGHVLRSAKQQVVVAGNIGVALLDALATALDDNCLPQTWVLELSSFQLYGCSQFAANAATVLNLSQDHLDWHSDMAEYIAAKAKIFDGCTTAILNRDDDAVMELQTQPEKRPCITFGSDKPTQLGDFGLLQEAGITWLVRAVADEAAMPNRVRGKDTSPMPILLQRLMPADVLPIRGKHNACNALAALALGVQTGAPLAAMLHGLHSYQGEPHRVQAVARQGDIEFFDDSKATNVGATLAALKGLGAERKLVVIMGGEGKAQDFSPLADVVKQYTRAVVLIGRDAAIIQQALHATDVTILCAETLPQAVMQAAAHAQAGDAVLLSPACASFDMFDNYVQRGEVFQQAVRAYMAQNHTEAAAV